MRAISVLEKQSRTGLSKSGLPEIDYAVNPYHGCLHGCIYCFAIDFTPERDASANWGNVVYARTNLPELLTKELPKLRKGVVGLSTITDAYQPIEARYRLSRKCAEIILRDGFFLTIQTKSPLVTLDMDLWIKHRNSLDIGFTITSPSEKIARMIEPYTPSPSARIRALQELHRSGISTWIFLGPVIPGVNDDEKDLREIVRTASETGSRLIFDRYNHYKGASGVVKKILGKARYSMIMKEASGDWWKGVSEMLSDMCREFNVSGVTQQDDWIYEREQKQKNLLQY